MRATYQHVQYNISRPETLGFYKELLGYLEMRVVFENESMMGVSDGHTSFWFLPTPEENKAVALNRDAAGMNHLGLALESRDAVDTFYEQFMQTRGIEARFETPRARPDFGASYYQVMFEDPEGLAIEVFYA